MKYFGTDGIRLKATEFTPEFLYAVVRGLVDYAGPTAKVLIGGDTRESTEWILSDLEKILESFGLEHASVGVLPTPAIHYCFSRMGFDLAIDVTASHNPYQDNGIKIFESSSLEPSQSSKPSKPSSLEPPKPAPASSKNPTQKDPDSPSVPIPQKLSPAGCAAVEKSLEKGLSPAELPSISATLREDLHDDALSLYLDHLRASLGDADFSGLCLGMDCANGAMSVIGDHIFAERGAEVTLVNSDSSYGENINLNCGSTHLESLQKLVRDQNLDFGIAFDGDGDRCLMVDETGTIVDGDQILAILTIFYHLPSFVTTIMANQGLLNWAKSEGLTPEIADVGDSNVLSLMREKNIALGGEQSGHIILPGEPTGDGMLTALMATRAIASAKLSLSNLAPLEILPQTMINAPATPEQKSAFLAATNASAQPIHNASPDISKLPPSEAPSNVSNTANTSSNPPLSPDPDSTSEPQENPILALLTDYETKLLSVSGRLLVRPSGTENLIRVTMWGADAKKIETWAEELAKKLGETLK